MEDLFYFTKAPLNLERVVVIAEEHGYRSRFMESNGIRWLNVYYSQSSSWEWHELEIWGEDFAGFEEPQIEIIKEYGPVSAFQISHHTISLQELLALLKRILDDYGGWVGCDDGTFEVVYQAATIESLRYPYPTE